jgi:hypothetical protein
MPDEDRTIFAITSTKESAKEIIQTAVTELAKYQKTEEGEKTRYFFPNGIELISITVDVSGIKVVITVAGEKGIKPSARSEQIGRDPWDEVTQEVTEKQ